jgi:hypothetical protein
MHRRARALRRPAALATLARVTPPISHDREEESPEAKARWFQSLSFEERMELLCEFTDLVLENDPGVAEREDVEPSPGRVRVLSVPRR